MNKKKIYKILFILLPFILAFPFHFVYEYIPFPPFSIYFPVNESVFEHTKLTFTTLIIGYLIFYIIWKKHIDKKRYLSSLIISIGISTITMLSLYYLFDSITEKEIMILNILSLLIAIVIAQIVAISNYNKGINWSVEISIFSLITLTVILLIFTVNPPHLNFFFDDIKKIYGIVN